MSTRLAQLGLKKYDLDTVKDGREAVNIFARNQYDVILLDLQMPILNGIEAAKEIRRIERETDRESRTIILAVTADIFNSVEEECLSAGFDDCFPKPFSPTNMSARLEELYEKHSKRNKS